MIEVFTADLALIIITATALAFLARKTGQPTIVAYIATGLVLGPVMFNLVTESELTVLMSELGLGFLLFLLGIEMNLKEIEDLLRPIANIAVWQTVLQTGLAFVVPYLLGFSLIETVVIALCTVFGATPVIVKLLTDKDEISSLPGKIDVGVLILQDIYLVIILALFNAESLTNITAVGFALVKIFAMIGLVGTLSYLSSQYFLPRLFREIADDKHAFFVHGIAWAFLFISLATALDLSIEVGAFLAGLGLGQMPYRNELQERVRPLTDFFMVIFFSSIALTLQASNLWAYWIEAVLASVVLVIGNFLIMFFLINRQGFDAETTFIGSINMTQVSEFSLVVGGLAVTQGYIGNDILGYLSVMALLTMTSSTYLINYNRQIYDRVKKYLERFDSETSFQTERLEDHVLIIGYDDLARNTVNEMEKFFDQIAIVDRNPENVQELRNSEHEYIYGDIRHGEVKKKASVEKAEIIISFVPDFDLNKQILRMAEEDSTRILKAENFEQASELYEMDAHYVIVKNMLSGDRLGEQLKVYLEDRELFDEEVEEEKRKIDWRSRTWR